MNPFAKDTSFINRIMFPAPPLSYDLDLPNAWIPATTKSTRKQMPCLVCLQEDAKVFIIYSHGNGEDLGLIKESVEGLSLQLKANVFAYEYTGYGHHHGTSNETAVVGNSKSALSFVVDHLHWPLDNIVFYGYSVGGGPTMELVDSQTERFAGVILHSTFCSVREMVKSVVNGPVSKLVSDRFQNIVKIAKYTGPLLVIHGQEDQLIPFSHGTKLYQESPSIMKIMHPVETDHVHFDLNDLCTIIKTFLDQYLRHLKMDVPSKSQLNDRLLPYAEPDLLTSSK
eukprot:TRINITY_DN7749_c0_g1_i1.p1 TRINITY_DN7749_c0_g1~~TRINITY_DN7749_c0_g1_i1.p1  ORF type:complete len:283 (-),score=42.32 TRINITY_DN7749_c0_g1_i1:26-874(-)